MALMYSPPPLGYFLTLTRFDPVLLVPQPSAIGVIFLATIERIAHPTCAPIATYPCRDTPPLLVFDSNVISVITGDIVIDSVPTKSVVFVILLDTLLMTVHLNIFLPHSCLRSLEDLSSITTRGLVIEPGAQLYEGGNVMILFPHHSILLFTHTRRLLTWRGRRHSYITTSYLFIHTLSSFCFFDLHLDVANS